MTSPFLTCEPRLNPQLLQQAVGARERHDLAVGLGAAGQHELAAVRDHVGVDHRHAESLLGLGFADPERRLALRGLMRNEITGQHPQARPRRPDRRR